MTTPQQPKPVTEADLDLRLRLRRAEIEIKILRYGLPATKPPLVSDMFWCKFTYTDTGAYTHAVDIWGPECGWCADAPQCRVTRYWPLPGGNRYDEFMTKQIAAALTEPDEATPPVTNEVI